MKIVISLFLLKFGKELLRTVRNRTLLIIFLRRWGRGINAGGLELLTKPRLLTRFTSQRATASTKSKRHNCHVIMRILICESPVPRYKITPSLSLLTIPPPLLCSRCGINADTLRSACNRSKLQSRLFDVRESLIY